MKFGGQIKITGDAYCGFYSCGLSMLDSASMDRFTEEAFENKTVYKSQNGFQIEVDHCKSGLSDATEVITKFINNSDEPVTLEMMTSFYLQGIKADKVHRFTSFWSAEGRHKVDDIYELNLEKSWNSMAYRVEKFGNVGSMPVRSYFPFVALEDSENNRFVAIQLYSPASWQIEISCVHEDTLNLSGGIADRDFGSFLKTVNPGETFIAPKAVVAEGDSLLDVCDKLVKAQNPAISKVDNEMGIVFNEYCATWGNPTAENMKKVTDKIAGKGIQFLVMDSGWYGKDDGYWWDYLGDWSINTNRFPNGLKETADYIRANGMIPGIWFEFESVAEKSPLFNQADHLVKKDGVPLTVGNRRFLDMEDPWVIDYLKENVIGLLRDAGYSYIKVDYNDTMGIGCDGPDGMGENLRKKVIATQKFFKLMTEEIDGLVIENCSSGGHRLEPSMMELSSQASFSDAHEIPSLPIIAANTQLLIKPEQSQIWAVMRKEDSDSRIYYSMCSTLLGRMGLSGDIYDLSDYQWQLIDDGMEFYRKAAGIIKDGKTVVSTCDTVSYEKPTGGQLVVRSLGDKSLVVYHRFEKSESLKDFCIKNNIKLNIDNAESMYGNASEDFSAVAYIISENAIN